MTREQGGGALPSIALRDALGAIIDGRDVKRSRHELTWAEHDVTELFTRELEVRGFVRTTVEAVRIDPGERVPAFLVRQGIAWFGWVFWEKLTEQRLRKLFGSVVRNDKGDWAIQLSTRSQEHIFAGEDHRIPIDLDHPV